MESTNALLTGYACALSTNDLCNHIQSHIHPDTMTASATAELHLLDDYKKYKCALKVIDDAHICTDELLKSAVCQMMSTSLTTSSNPSSKRLNNTWPSTSNPTVSATSQSDGTSTHSSDCCPSLTTVEHTLLTQHGSCFQCCHFYQTTSPQHV